jgi:hypothetical protein
MPIDSSFCLLFLLVPLPLRDLLRQSFVRLFQVVEDPGERDRDRADRVVADELDVPEIVGVHRRALEEYEELVHLLADIADEDGALPREPEVFPAKPLVFLDERRHRIPSSPVFSTRRA